MFKISVGRNPKNSNYIFNSMAESPTLNSLPQWQKLNYLPPWSNVNFQLTTFSESSNYQVHFFQA